MKEGETQSIQSSDAVRGTSVLLPEASITVFSRDKETLEAAEVFEKDWRLLVRGLYAWIVPKSFFGTVNKNLR